MNKQNQTEQENADEKGLQEIGENLEENFYCEGLLKKVSEKPQQRVVSYQGYEIPKNDVEMDIELKGIQMVISHLKHRQDMLLANKAISRVCWNELTQWQTLPLTKLKKYCESAGVPVSGSKETLALRMIEWEKEQGDIRHKKKLEHLKEMQKAQVELQKARENLERTSSN